jgi:uncharacterized membrane protein YqjE
VDLKVLLGRLNRDATQFVHDELELAKLELRDVAEAFAEDVQSAGRTLARDIAMIGVALSLATLAGLALTAGAILAVGQLLGGAFWAGGLIVGAVLLIAAGIMGWSAVKDLGSSDSLRLEHGRTTLREDRDVLRDEARRTKAAAREGAADFKREATRDPAPRH